MTKLIFSFPFDEANVATSPQLPVADFAATSGVGCSTNLVSGRVETAGASDRLSSGPSQLSLIVALAAELEATEARARRSESVLAVHGRHCICRAAEVADEETAVEYAVVSIAGMAVRCAMASADGADRPTLLSAQAQASDCDVLSLAA